MSIEVNNIQCVDFLFLLNDETLFIKVMVVFRYFGKLSKKTQVTLNNKMLLSQIEELEPRKRQRIC